MKIAIDKIYNYVGGDVIVKSDKSKLTETITMKTDKETKEKIEKIAENERRTISQIMQFIVEDYLQRKESGMA